MFNAVFCAIPGFDASEMDVLSCDVWMLVLFVCWIGLWMKKFMPEPMQHGTPIRSCKISEIDTWIFEIHVLGCFRIIKKGEIVRNVTTKSSFFCRRSPSQTTGPHVLYFHGYWEECLSK